MSLTRIASRYAKSLLELAQDQTQLDAVVRDVAYIKSALDTEDFRLLIQSPIINSQRKKEIFDNIFSDKLQPLTLAFLDQTIKKRREAILPQILKEFDRQFNQLNNLTEVTLTLPGPTDEDIIQKIKTKLEHSGLTTNRVSIKTSIDPSIIGGYIIQFGDKRFDASVAFKLEQLKQTFSNA